MRGWNVARVASRRMKNPIIPDPKSEIRNEQRDLRQLNPIFMGRSNEPD